MTKFKSFPQRMGSFEVPPTQILLTFTGSSAEAISMQINEYVSKMLVEVDTITMTIDIHKQCSAIVVFRDQKIKA